MVDENFKKIICNRIISLRRKHNLNQEQLAYQSGISKGGLNEIEKYLKIPLIYNISTKFTRKTIRYSELELILSEIGYHVEFVEDKN